MTFDEKNFKQKEVLEKSMTFAVDPQIFALSNVPLYPDHESLQMFKEWEKDKSWQIKKFTAPKKYSWKNPKAWEKANPFYGHKDFRK